MVNGSGAQPVDWLAIGPPLLLVLSAIAVLFTPARARSASAVIGVLLAGGSLSWLAIETDAFAASGSVHREAFCTPDGCSYQVDELTLVVQLVVLAGTLVVLLLSGRREGEYHFLLLASATGAVSIAAARDLITIVVALELVTLPAIALVGLRSDARSAESAVKFFLFSVVSSAVMLFGIGLLYGLSGSLQLEAIGERLAGAGSGEQAGTHPGVLTVAAVLSLVGFAFKLGAVPFHFWVPDTYVGAPVPVAAYLSVVSKTAGLVALISVVGLGFGASVPGWPVALAVVAGLTMTVGNLVALRQSEAVRLLAWSGVAQAGFVLLPLGAAGSEGPGGPGGHGGDGVLGASVAYLVIYAVFNLGAFGVVTLLGGHRGLEGFRGLVHTRRWLALALAFFLLGLAGLPPGLAGLFGKVVVIDAAVRGGAVWLAVLAAINVAIGLAYYLRWAALLFAEPSPVSAGERAARPVAGPLPADAVSDAASADAALASTGDDTAPEDTAPEDTGDADGPVAGAAGNIAVGSMAVAGVALSVAPGLALGLVSVLP